MGEDVVSLGENPSIEKAHAYLRGFTGAMVVLVLYGMGSCLNREARNNATAQQRLDRLERRVNLIIDAPGRLDGLEHRVNRLEMRP